MIHFADDNIYLDVFVFVRFITLPSFLFCRYDLYLNWSDLFRHFYTFSFSDIFLSNFNKNCKSNFDNISIPNSAIYHHQISSPYSPDSKSPSILNSHLRRPFLKCRKAIVAEWK